MKKSFKGFIMGLIMGLVISCVCVGAVTGVVTKELHYNDIKVTLNGKEITPKDANGKVVEPFIIDGTTYLPVRAVADALGLDVNWDGETNTVKLGKDSADSSDIPSGVGSVIYDKDGVKITYLGVERSDELFTELSLMVENNSGEILNARCMEVYVNGFEMGYFSEFATNLRDGKKSVHSINIHAETLKTSNITNFETVEFTFRGAFFTESDKIIDDFEETITFRP